MSTPPTPPRTTGDAAYRIRIAQRKARQVAPAPQRQAAIDAYAAAVRQIESDAELARVIRGAKYA